MLLWGLAHILSVLNENRINPVAFSLSYKLCVQRALVLDHTAHETGEREEEGHFAVEE